MYLATGLSLLLVSSVMADTSYKTLTFTIYNDTSYTLKHGWDNVIRPSGPLYPEGVERMKKYGTMPQQIPPHGKVLVTLEVDKLTQHGTDNEFDELVSRYFAQKDGKSRCGCDIDMLGFRQHNPKLVYANEINDDQPNFFCRVDEKGEVLVTEHR
ncbi:MAG: hypothetical protein K0R24_1992 [Gammaproteobacteria bacterium]|nr:hypothetical protein [Gammaproteobacteria bacterium]